MWFDDTVFSLTNFMWYYSCVVVLEVVWLKWIYTNKDLWPMQGRCNFVSYSFSIGVHIFILYNMHTQAVERGTPASQWDSAKSQLWCSAEDCPGIFGESCGRHCPRPSAYPENINFIMVACSLPPLLPIYSKELLLTHSLCKLFSFSTWDWQQQPF